jgi:alkanesulfonate monooxygenase SsuD/methylene tetrahydromethanopterin reductase-like flavin-dependent oxidoreductase (luciferase family)
MGIGKPLKSILHMNPDIPIWLGTGTEANVKLTAEIADGWFPLSFVPGMMDVYRPWLEEGCRRAGNGKSIDDLEIQTGVTVQVTDDVGSALGRMKPGIALYVGGMGHKNKNFHNDMMVRRGYGDAAARIQELYLAGRKQEAMDAVPDEYCDAGALIGPEQRIRDRYREWEGSGVTGLTVFSSNDDGIDLMADLAGTRDQIAST